MRSDLMEERNRTREYLEEQLEIEILKEGHPYDTRELDEIFEILLDTLCSNKKTIRISGDEKPIEVVKSVFMKLDSSHIEYALECFKKNTTEVRNIRAYMLATLYNAPFTMNSYYTSLVHHDILHIFRYLPQNTLGLPASECEQFDNAHHLAVLSMYLNTFLY